MLKLHDSDRGWERGSASNSGVGGQSARVLRSTGEYLNYKLKDVSRSLLNLIAKDFPGPVENRPLDELVPYLKSDLAVTSLLQKHLDRIVVPRILEYNEQLVSPVTKALVRMTNDGVKADLEFIKSESHRLLDLMTKISDFHFHLIGQRLDVGDYHLRGWIYCRGLQCRKIKSGKLQQLSLRATDLLELRKEATRNEVRSSLELILDYKQIQSLMRRLKSLELHVCRHDNRIHSTFNDVQSSGRVSSSKPNLQQVASELKPGGRKQLYSEPFREETLRSRNAIVASDGSSLVAFDISQADIRVLSHTVDSFEHDGASYLRKLQAARLQRLPPIVEHYWQRSRKYIQKHNKRKIKCPKCWHLNDFPMLPVTCISCENCGEQILVTRRGADFNPDISCQLAEDFMVAGDDFYTTATRRMLGREPKDKTERNHLKQTILGIVNGMSSHSLAKRLEVSQSIAVEYLRAFENAYPQVAAYKELSKHEFAITGESWSLGGHHRQITAHRWMVTEPEVELFVSYRGADKLWIRVIPLRPNRHTLTCWVLSVVDAKYGSKNEGLEIYHHRDGRISSLPYKFFNDSALVYRLPVRNVSWRLIRKVRTKTEEAVYDGYDKTWRQLFNHVAQGGTADIVKLMMLRSQSLCEEFVARLLLQIHDELVFEVPDECTTEFAIKAKALLSTPPLAGFKVPIVVEPRVGKRFGELIDLAPSGV